MVKLGNLRNLLKFSYTLNNVTWRLSSLGIISSILDTHTLAELSIISKSIENKF